MGIFKGARNAVLSGEARRAVEEGRTVFAPMLNVPITQQYSATVSGAVTGWAEMIESIEAEGWRLEHWAIGQDMKGRPQAYPLFRRNPGAPA
jgi:hypothetical protein